MSNNLPRNDPNDQLERFLDDLLSPAEREAASKGWANHPEIAAEIELQQQLDQRLREALAPPDISQDQVEQWLAADPLCHDVSPSGDVQPAARSKPSNHPNRRRWIVFTSLATTVLLMLGLWFVDGKRHIRPHFEPRSLTAIYAETVEQGFRPYYFCDDAERFALTFAKRQQTPLELAEMPADRHMVGLSYPGGLSRNTTAILCYVQEQPVVVFVDGKEFDTDVASSGQQPELFLHRKTLGNLVVYEVGPFSSSQCLDFLRIKKADE
ncbi:MAG: hypothetical protein R3C28_27605 [Pirellulaceae bacterium]